MALRPLVGEGLQTHYAVGIPHGMIGRRIGFKELLGVISSVILVACVDGGDGKDSYRILPHRFVGGRESRAGVEHDLAGDYDVVDGRLIRRRIDSTAGGSRIFGHGRGVQKIPVGRSGSALRVVAVAVHADGERIAHVDFCCQGVVGAVCFPFHFPPGDESGGDVRRHPVREPLLSGIVATESLHQVHAVAVAEFP